jgi:hypothetical protein
VRTHTKTTPLDARKGKRGAHSEIDTGFDELTVDQAISEAEYGIKRMKENVNPFDFYLKGTLTCLKGALDYLLEEYNAKYSVGISDGEDLNTSIFEKRAKAGRNRQAELFIGDYLEEKKTLLADPRCGKLLGRHGSRDIIIHRREPTKNVTATFYEHITSSEHVEVRDGKGNLVSSGDTAPQTVMTKPPEVQYFLSDWPSDDIPTLCEHVLNEVRKLVVTIRANHP